MIKTRYSDFTPEEIEYTIKLLNRKTPLPIIRKKTKLSHNEILSIIKKNNLPYEKEQLPIYTINDKAIIISSDNHKGSRLENKLYEQLIISYARSHNIRTIINCGDEIQAQIPPLRYGLNGQTNAYLSAYPGKNIVTLLLGGNHELRAIEKNPEIYNVLISRRDVKFLGLGAAYLLWQGQLISVHHSISKFDLDLPSVKCVMNFSGHHHFFNVVNNSSIYVPTSSDDLKKSDSKPGFLVATLCGRKLVIKKNNLGKEIVEKGVVYSKNII